MSSFHTVVIFYSFWSLGTSHCQNPAVTGIEERVKRASGALSKARMNSAVWVVTFSMRASCFDRSRRGRTNICYSDRSTSALSRQDVERNLVRTNSESTTVWPPPGRARSSAGLVFGVSRWCIHCYLMGTLGRRSFSVADPTVWNSLPDELRDQGCRESNFEQSLKTYLVA